MVTFCVCRLSRCRHDSAENGPLCRLNANSLHRFSAARCSLQLLDIFPGGQINFPPRARQAEQTVAADQVHQCAPDPGRYAERGDAPVYAPPRPQDWATAGVREATTAIKVIAIASQRTHALILTLQPLRIGISPSRHSQPLADQRAVMAVTDRSI